MTRALSPAWTQAPGERPPQEPELRLDCSKAARPLGWRCRLANSLSVNSLPLSVSSLLILMGQALCNAFRNALALAALLLVLMATNTQRVALSMATNR